MVKLAIEKPDAQPFSPEAPGWLLSAYEDHQWLVADSAANRNDTRTATLNFDYILPSGSHLTAPENAELLRVVKTYCYLIREHEYSTVETAQTHYAQQRSLLALVAWMDLHGIRSFEEFTPNDVAKYVLDAKYGFASILHLRRRILELEASGVDVSDQHSVRKLLHLSPSIKLAGEIENRHQPQPEGSPLRHMPLLRALLPLEELWLWRDEIGKGAMPFRPFEVSASATAARHCSATNRTKTIPDRQAMVLLDGCLRMVLELGPTIVSLHQEVRAIVSSGESRAKRSKHLDFLRSKHAPEFELLEARLQIDYYEPHGPAPFVNVAVRLLVNMCFILVAALSARRHKEILSIEEGCIRGNARDGLWIYSAILKNERQHQHTPVPEVVEHVVGLLTDLSSEARQVAGNSKLFQWCETKTAKYPRVSNFTPTMLDDVARLCNVPLYEGEAWRFTAMQFRRFFAIIYMWRYHHSDLAVLKHHLRHWNFETTRDYASEPEIGRIFTQEQREMTRRIIVDAATGARNVGGASGVRLQKMVERAKKRFSAKMVPMTMDRLVPWAEKLASKVFLKSNPWSYCLAHPSLAGARESNCRKGNLGPNDKGANLAAARPEVCSSCKFNMTDAVFTPYLETEVSQVKSLLSNPHYADSLLAAVSRQRLASIEPYLADQPQPLDEET